MFRRRAAFVLAPASLVLVCAPAHAGGLGGEVNYAHADGRDGAEAGAGYALSFQGFSLTPGAGVFIRDGGTSIYGRVEAAYTLPAAMTIGLGVRVGDEARVYGTVALPVLPKVAIKGNLGDHYAAIGLKVGF